VHGEVKADGLGPLLAEARNHPDAAPTIGSGGVGTSIHLAGALLAQQSGAPLRHIPYRGQPDAVADLIAGRITMMPLAATIAAPHAETGALRMLATTSSRRSSLFPDLPTVAEAADLPDYAASTWTGFVVRAEVPADIVRRLSDDIGEILQMAEVREELARLGMDLAPRDAAAFDAFLAGESEKWAKVISSGNLQLE